MLDDDDSIKSLEVFVFVYFYDFVYVLFFLFLFSLDCLVFPKQLFFDELIL